MRIILITAFICLFVCNIQAQNKQLDSLKNLLNNAVKSNAIKPIEQFDLLNKILDQNDGIQGNLQDPAIGLQMHKIAQQLENDSLLAISTNVVGNYFRGKSDLPVALDYFFKAIPLAEKASDKRRLSSLYFDIAECYYNLQIGIQRF